jgi:hypothetical protein
MRNSDEDSAQGPNVVVLSYRLWKRRFGGDYKIIGKAISLDTEWYSTVSGDGEWMTVSPGYFGVLKTPILRGRDFNSSDTADAPAVVFINETTAKRFWAGQNPVGQQILIGKGLGPKFNDRPRQIIGIVSDTRDDETQPCVWPTLRTNYGSSLNSFLAMYPRGTVPAKMSNHRVGGQRVGWRSDGERESFLATSRSRLPNPGSTVAFPSPSIPDQ